jgi:hypothetical protein
MKSTEEYVESAQLSLQEGFPAEASKIIDQGYSAGLLGTGPDAARHKRLNPEKKEGPAKAGFRSFTKLKLI